MILKTLTHDRGDSDCWNYYDNILNASVFFDEASKMSCISISFKEPNANIVLALTDVAYLCNDKGQTIEKLLPAVSSKK